MLIEDVFHRFIPVHGLFMETIHFLRTHFLGVIDFRGLNFGENDIMYVLTIPAIWTDAAKQTMRESAFRVCYLALQKFSSLNTLFYIKVINKNLLFLLGIKCTKPLSHQFSHTYSQL